MYQTVEYFSNVKKIEPPQNDINSKMRQKFQTAINN